jgi:hypothetical protein
VARWTCPRCDREFGRTRQSHDCVPGNSVEVSFAKHPEQRPIYDAIMEHLAPLGPVHIDPVQIGVFLKSDRKLAELRPKQKWLSASLYLAHRIDDARVARVYESGATRFVNEIKLRSVDDVDDQFTAWLTEAYDENTD